MAEYTNWSVEKKLARARAILAGKALKKSGVNKQRYQDKKTGEWKEMGFSYFELSDFLPETLKIFDELGLCGVFTITPSHAEEIKTDDGLVRNGYPEVAELKVINADNKDDYIIFKEPTAQVEMKTAIQSLGAKKTYLRRYLWIDCMEIAENDLVDAQPVNDDKATKSSKKKEEPNILADLAVRLTTATNNLKKVGVDIRDDTVISYVTSKAKVSSLDPGILLGDSEGMARVIAVYEEIYRAKTDK